MISSRWVGHTYWSHHVYIALVQQKYTLQASIKLFIINLRQALVHYIACTSELAFIVTVPYEAGVYNQLRSVSLRSAAAGRLPVRCALLCAGWVRSCDGLVGSWSSVVIAC